MNDYNFLEIYFPPAGDLSPERLLEMRDAAQTLIRSVYPTVDTSPGSVFGDLFVSPSSPALTAHEQAWNRLSSDLNPENVEAGTAYNCDFLRQFYLNLGIQDESSQRSYGLVRLEFDSADAREIDRSTTFLIGDGTYRPYLPQAGPLYIYPVGQSGVAGTNYRNYSFYSATSYAVDLLVTGNAGQLASAGSTVQIDRDIEGLSSALALSDFAGGTTPDQLQELARRTRSNFYSRTPTTRGGATNLVHQQFPEITLTGCTVSGDFEMVRDVQNPLQVAAGHLDLMVRSPELLTDSVTVRLRQMFGQSGETIYSGWLDLPEIPIKILSITNVQTVVQADLFSVSLDPEALGLAAAYGASERLLASIPYTEDSTGQPIIRAEIDADGVYADFTVSYLFDPALKICQEFMSGDENTPAGLDLYVRWFVPVDVEALEVDFNRKAGTTLNLESARAEILTAFNSSRFETPVSAAAIDTAFYYAGAHSVNSIEIIGYVRYSVATNVWLGNISTLTQPTTPEEWQTFWADVWEVPVIPVTSVYLPQYTYSDTSNPSTYAVSGPRNVTYLLASSALKLTERRSV